MIDKNKEIKMATSGAPSLPMIQEPTRAQSENVETIMNRIHNQRVVIPDYQRDAEQWDSRKESLFIESLLNNLTIPAFFFAENSETGKIEVVDGQQRLNTLRKFWLDELTLSKDDDMVYLAPQSVHYRGKKFSELHQDLQNTFNDYPLTVIYLPRNIDLTTKLEIFRRINEGGTPLTSQDIRLSYYSDSKSIVFIRLAGTYTNSEATSRVIESAEKRGVPSPWKNYPKAWEIWQDWWKDKTRAKGQTPSEMFLWYLVLRYRDALDQLLSNQNAMEHLTLSFREKTEEALDIYCAQLQYTEVNGGTTIFPGFGNGIEQEFNYFATWIEYILGAHLPGLSVDKYKQMALFIGACVELKIEPDQIGDDSLDAIAEFIRTPRQSGNKWLGEKGGYPEPKGRWRGSRGQKGQCDLTVELLKKILASE
jgi:hypothetical protein